MASPEVKVKITAQDEVESTIRGVQSTLRGIAAFVAGSAVAGFFKSATDAAIEFDNSQRKLEATAKLTGIALMDLESTAKAGRDNFKLSVPVANDFATELGRLAAKAGDVSKATPGMAAFLDLGAARGLTASETLKAVQQAVLGIDEGTDKLFGKNPSVLYQEYAAQIGTSAGKLSDQEKAQALLNAALSDGLKVQGEYGRFLGTLGGSLDAVRQRWDQFKVAVGQAVNSGGDVGGMAGKVSEALASMATWVKENEETIADLTNALFLLVTETGNAIGRLLEIPGVSKALTVSMQLLGGAFVGLASLFRRVFGVIQETIGNVVATVGGTVQRMGGLLQKFGIDVSTETAKSMTEWGRTMQQKGYDQVQTSERLFMEGMDRIWQERVNSNDKAEREEDRSQKAVTRIHDTGNKERLTKAQEAAQLHRDQLMVANEIFERVSKALEDSARPVLKDIEADWSVIEGQVVKAAKEITIAKQAQEKLADATEDVRERQEEVTKEANESRERFEDNVDSAVSLGISLVGVATQMGAIDDRAGRALTSVINMGASIAKFGLGSPEGILSVVNGLANLIGGWGSSAAEQARKDAMMKNTRAIEELSRDLGEYNLDVSGRTFSGVTDVLGGIFEKSPNGRFVGSAELSAALQGSGLTLGDARRLADKFGIDVDNDQLGWFKLLQQLKSRKFGSPEGNFGEELSSLTDSFDVLGTEDEDDRLSAFRKFLRGKVDLLADALDGTVETEAGRTAIADRLKQLYRDSINGKIPIANYGDASAPQFRSLIATLLQLLGKADGTLQSGAPAASSSSIGASAAPSTFGSLSTGGASGGFGGSGLFGASGATAPALTLGGDTIGTLVQGSLIFNVTAAPGDDAEALAERISRILASKLTLQNAALGVRT